MMKTGKNKRLLASILAASMLLAMSPFALAEGAEDTTNQTGQGQTVEGGGTGTTTGSTESTGIAEAEEPATPSETQSEIAEPEIRLTSSGPRRIIRPADKVTQTYQFYCGESTDPYYTETIRSNDTLTDPGIPSGEGEFLGWYLEDTKLTFDTKTFDKSETFKVTAKFEGVNYFYFMNSTEDDAIVSATKVLHKDDAAITSLVDVAIPLDSTHGVAGWYTDKELKNKVASLSYDETAGCVFLYPDIQKGFWITYESNGGSYLAPQFFTAKGATAPTAPTRSGYTFTGWFTDSELNQRADFSAIAGPTTVYAGWKVADTKYTVVHWWENADDDEFSYHESESLNGTTGELTAATAKTYEGFTAQPITQETIAGDNSTIVNVYYERNEYAVKFYGFIVDNGFWQIGNEKTEKRITAKHGAKICDQWPGGIWVILTDDLKDETSDTGFRKFANEAEYDAYIEEHQTEYQANLVVMPLNGANYWYTNMDSATTAEYYLETLNDGEYNLDHTDSGADVHSVISPGDSYAITGFTFDHYVPGVWTDKEYLFLKEYLEDPETEYKDKWNGSKFYYTRNSYDVIYMNNGDDPVNRVTYKYQADISKAAEYTPDRPEGIPSDYVFKGWYFDQTLKAPYNFAGQTMPAGNITVYAKWGPPICNVKFMAYGKEVANYNDIPYNTSVSEKIPTVALHDGDRFYGWAYDVAGTQPFNVDTRITRDIVLYAQINDGKSYAVTYDSNGGTGTVADSNRYAQNKLAKVLSSNGLIAPEGKVFLGWNTKADGTGEMKYPGSSVLVTGNITLYAVWGNKTPGTTLVYHANDGSDRKITEPYANNATVTLKGKDTFTRSGYTFSSWNTQADGKGASFKPDDKVIVDNIESNDLYAIWTKNSSGGGGGGGRKPTVTIPDDVPTGLNGDDHYAYIVGYPDKTVRPQNGITRAEVATIFFRLLTDETRNANSTKSNSYADVDRGAWYNHAVSTLSAMGIVKGDTKGKFNPNASITRAEFAAIAARFDDKANTTAADFSDIASHWAKNEISAASNKGWINGYPDGTFKPDNHITRAEAMTLVNRVLKRLPETRDDLRDDMIKWSDNSDASQWFYLAVQEATNSHYYKTKENKFEKWTELRKTRDWTELEK
nr:InlB B-repeat-containing protein [uncultured Agathobaculum sp.]